MKILNNDNELVISYDIYQTKDINRHKSLEKMINTRRLRFFYNCPREYLHLIDIQEWFIIDEYNLENDYNLQTLTTILDSRYRLTLLTKSYLDRIKKELDKIDDIGYTLMEDSDDLYLLYISDESEDNTTLAYYISKNIDRTRLLRSGEASYITSETDLIYDDNLISILYKQGIIILTDIIEYNVDSKLKGVICKYKNFIYFLTIDVSKNGTNTINFSNKILLNGTNIDGDVGLYAVGDIVLYDSVKYIVAGAYYGKNATDLSTHGYKIVNIRTGTEVYNVSPYELKSMPKIRLL